MLEIFVQISTTIVSGCAVTLFAHWLRKRNEK
ncbi:type I toxin-antitoxin system Fst family toxin [Mammaliicoccus sciuri]|nr:type I toxin-antitoxin system Fst family toxin [Mammaliicoccus sciuri]